MIFERETTGRGLDAGAALLGLSDYGLFAEKIPPCFSSEGLSQHISTGLKEIQKEENPEKLQKVFKESTHSHIRYQETRHINIPRHMAIPHPESHLAQCLAIQRVWEEIKEHCSKPEAPVSRVFVRKIIGHGRVFKMNYKGEERSALEEQEIDGRVFKMNYKGEERFDLEEQEIDCKTGARHVAHADISKCFSSIYTHSIAWAMHGKKDAKTQKSKLSLPGNLLDFSCRVVADGQTNGIHIGPHTSNVISEMILTKVDSALLKKKYKCFSRHIDDYTFYSRSYEEAERFIHDVGLELRKYELFLNESKTRIDKLPQPQTANWKRELQTFQLPEGVLRYSTVRSFMDLALSLAQESGESSVLNYAIKMVPKRLNQRAKKLFVKDVISLALSFPYLAPLMGKHVFKKHAYSGIENEIKIFVDLLLELGLQKIYPDAIAHALYYSLQNKLPLSFSECNLQKVLNVKDCVCDVLVFEYAKVHKLASIKKKICKRANDLKGLHKRDQDSFWLLIYQVWSENELRSEKQTFLADLKKQSFQFFKI